MTRRGSLVFFDHTKYEYKTKENAKKYMSSMKCVDCKRTECECKDKCFDSLVERKFLVPIFEAEDEKSHGVLLFKWFLPMVRVQEHDEIRLIHVSTNKTESVSEEDYVDDVLVPILNFHGVKRIKLLIEQGMESEISEKICEAATECDLIVMAASQQQGRSNKHIGRVSSAEVKNATVPMFMWRATEVVPMREEEQGERSFREVK